MNKEIHISSLIVHAHPARQSAIAAHMTRFPDLELHVADASGKMVVTLESDSEAAILDCLAQISRLDGVLAANLVYHHSEDAASLEEEIPHENHTP